MPADSKNLALRLYYLHPRIAGPLADWTPWLAHARELGFSHIVIAPPFVTGGSDDIFLSAEHDRLHPLLAGKAAANLKILTDLVHNHGMQLVLDVPMDRLAADAALRGEQPEWFRPVFNEHGTPDPRWTPSEGEAVLWRYNDAGVRKAALAWWGKHFADAAAAGVDGFRILAPEVFDAAEWTSLIDGAGDALFLAWTPGVATTELQRLAGAPFTATFASTPWWDFHHGWYAEEAARLELIAPAIVSVEAPFAGRLAVDHGERAPFERAYRRAIDFAAANPGGWLLPMGFEFGAHEPLDARRSGVQTVPEVREGGTLDLAEAIRRANERVASERPQIAAQARVSGQVGAWVYLDAAQAMQASAARIVLVNADLVNERSVGVAQLSRGPLAAFAPLSPEQAEHIVLAPGEVRELLAGRSRPVGQKVAGITARRALDDAAAAPRIAVESVTPAVDDGRFPVKCIVGETVSVQADIFMDGHDVLAAVVRWRALDERQWREVPMRVLGNDRYVAEFVPTRVGRFEYVVQAWRDAFATFHHELEVKVAAGVTVTLELEEGRRLVESTASASPKARGLKNLLAALNKADDEGRQQILLDTNTQALMHAADPRPFSVESSVLVLGADRREAGFASWYELFPRSETTDPNRHGTFLDVVDRLPAIQAMGFDVLYFPPIHPIGKAFRKGRNNTLTPGETDVGSPYAIGSAEGGHTAIHPQLGTIDDFRTLRDQAAAHGLELALDFAIQCSPDHPWLKEHPEWFDWRPDGSIRYAENPPKKYQDIVNVDFYAKGAVPSLWQALCDAVMFWAAEGVRIFRVDNPHTKPFPFWEWMIARVRASYPDALFLAEAFTRPKPMYRLAKAGFGQSYTYFTWRHTKQEFTDYLTELSTMPPKDFFRPNFFVNTPDINPVFLQTSGRPGFLIRAALAATLSGLWGVYSGFEICEAAPMPGKEEYLDSEKYEIRVRDYNAPGNIVAEITQLNMIRRAHPALQDHRNIRFLPSGSDQVLVFEKATPERDDIVLVAINLDPYNAQATDFYLPLAEWGADDGTPLVVHDLLHDVSSTWHGSRQEVWLGQGLPYAIWHLTLPGA